MYVSRAMMPPAAGQRARVIFNPSAGRARRARMYRAAAISVDWLCRQGIEAELVVTERPNHARSLAAEAVALGYDTVVVAGGDGTLNEVIQALAGSEVALGVLPMGTVNIWATEVGIAASLSRARQALIWGRRQRIDLGLAGDRYFLLMAGIGFDAEVVRRVEQQTPLRRLPKMLSYALTVAQHGANWPPVKLWLADGEGTISEPLAAPVRALMAVIGNTRRYAGPFSFTRHALADDGLLDVVVLEDGSTLRRLGIIASALLHRHGRSYTRAASVRVSSDPPLLVQVDGELLGPLPMTFSVAPRALNIIVPANRRHQLFSNAVHPFPSAT